ncbi:MAG: hypothetical protein K9G26_08370 [Emcibacter sp.]|nr:hypothetical protein [Emcibacter sp.]
MGDFILYNKNKLSETKIKTTLSSLAHQGSKNPILAEHDSYVICCFPKQISPIDNIFTDDHGDFCAASGTFIYKNQMGTMALKSLLHDFNPDHYQPEDYSGIFTIILKKDNRLFLFTDPLGGSRIYQNDQRTLWSSSFLAAATASHSLSPNKQCLYEYAFQETTYGQETVFHEIKCMDALKIFEIKDDGLVAHQKNLIFDYNPSSDSRQNLVTQTATLLQNTVKPISQIFGDKIRTALSGGYDSRLMLSLLKNSGSNPHVYVYGPDNSPDVKIAQSIAKAENFTLDHINKGKYPTPSPDDYKNIVQDNFYALDGLPTESIFDFGANMKTRRKRAEQGHMVFNGGGGEIFRNFFYLPDGNFTITDLINSFYARYANIQCQDVFDEKEYRNNLRHKIKAALGVESDNLSRTEIEFAYPAFRLRYWTSRDNNNNTRLGSYLTPFISYKTIKQALTIPLSLKNHGTFQADLIKIISPTLASYLSDYGYAFDESVPNKIKLKNYLTYYRPTILRRYSYAIQHKMRKLILPKTLEPAFLNPIFPDGTPHMDQYFKIENIKDVGMLSRIYTMEYLFRYFNL